MTSRGLLGLAAGELALATDLYELTMAAVYRERRPGVRASFELFVRRLPACRRFLVWAGLEQALASLEALRFGAAQIDYIRSLPVFQGVSPGFFEDLRAFRFRGDVWAMPEGTVFFAGQPALRVEGDLLEAQLVETLLLSIVNFQTVIASKAARIRLAAGSGVQLAEFGSRRAHGPQAALWVARAAYLAGFDATSNVLAGFRLGVPVVGTMAHSFVMAFDSELEAFAAYERRFPDHTVLLVDTYDSLEAVRKVLAAELPFQGVRLDSGDPGRLAFAVRELLDAGGRPDAKIFVSGDMDELRIAELRARGAPIDAFGVGTRLSTAADAPYLGGVYKLVEIRDARGASPRVKSSEGKATLPGRKQVLRHIVAGRMRGDRVVPEGTRSGPEERPLLRQVVRRGEVITHEGLEVAREHCQQELGRLGETLTALEDGAAEYPVKVDPMLEQARRAAERAAREA